MYIMLCFFILFLGYLIIGISFYLLKKREVLKEIKLDYLPLIVMLILCGLIFLVRMLTPYLSPALSLWISIPEKLKNVDKAAAIHCSFDYLFLVVLVLIGWIDYKQQIIPNILNGLILVLGLFKLISDMVVAETIGFTEHIIGLLVLSVPLVIISIFYKGSFGMGDVKLLASAGFFMGWKDLVMGTFLGSFIAAIICIVSLLRHKMGLKDKIAFGPYLCIGIGIMTVAGWISY